MKNNLSKQTPTSRRRFLELLTASGAGLFAAPNLFAKRLNNANVLLDNSLSNNLPLVDSPPVLQCPTETSITVVWAVGRPAAGYVEFGTDKNRLDQKAYGDKYGLKPYHERFLQIRIQGLKPNTRYYYRTVTRSFDFVNAYKFEQGEPVYSEVFSFETSGSKKSTGSFSVINDTHNNQETLKRLAERLALINSDYTVWNGDLVSSFDSADMAVETVLRPGNAPFATEKPMLFVPGNHDYRGVWARNIPLLLPEWEHPAPEDRAFGRNFVVRTGPLALIGLDTGEDKPDAHPAWGGLASFEPYRTAQRNWLERALKSPAVATAPFVVAFCHISLYWPDPNGNGGDSMDGYASYQRQAANLWGPLLTKYGVQCLVVGHEHRFGYFPATSDRGWAQVRGGGPGPKGEVTVIHGTAKGNSLEIIVDELNSGKELGRWTFPKRK
jgi:predicted phosphodiesterase